MFATITGRLPPQPETTHAPAETTHPSQAPAETTQPPAAATRDPGAGVLAADERVRAILEAQATAGLELLSDAQARWSDLAGFLAAGLGLPGDLAPDDPRRASRAKQRAAAAGRIDPRWERPVTLGAWQSAAATTGLPVKATIVGPYTLAWYVAERSPRDARPDRRRLAIGLADALHEELGALVAAGCPLVEVIEDAATRISDREAERTLFQQSQFRLTRDLGAAHLSLTIRGGNADGAGAATILDAPYASYLFDLIAGPDNWRLIRNVPGNRGVVCGALDPRPTEHPLIEELVWAAHYAASSNGRGLERVGLAPASGLDGCTWDEAGRRMALLGEAARLATASTEEIGRRLDPRAVDIRSAAMGRYAPQARRRTAGPDEG